MANDFNIEEYLSNGVEDLVKNAIRASFSNPKESLFMAKFALAAKRANAKRHASEEQGEHIPPFLIASITSACNLHCAGCYSRANDACHDSTPVDQMTAEEWDTLFTEASDLGISFVLLAGGEPFMRKDIISKAAGHSDILFPIFTNGTMVTEEYLDLFDKNRNLVPLLSIEGGKDITDLRRGEGVYWLLNDSMRAMREKGILFGASVTVTTENMDEVLSDAFMDDLYAKGVKVIIYVEFVPVTEEAQHLAPGDEERAYISEHLDAQRMKRQDMVMIAFPGDEKVSEGCLAAGRGFFHINSHGGAEPCPFSPYSDISVREVGLKGAMNSPLFRTLQDERILAADHAGGCVLFQRKDEVEAILHGEE